MKKRCSFLESMGREFACAPAEDFLGRRDDLVVHEPALARLPSRIANVVPVDRPRAAISSLALGAAILQRRQNLVWFAGGRRSPTGELQRLPPPLGRPTAAVTRRARHEEADRPIGQESSRRS
jgi:hypothetical protein